MSDKIDVYSIAWLLMAIYFAEGGRDKHVPVAYHKMEFPEDLMNQYKNILPIVFTGDYINKAIFTDEELKIGIQYLLDKGFITVNEGFLVTSEKFRPAYKKTAKKMGKYKKGRTRLDVVRQLIQEIIRD
jgi:hypothetical protein